MDACPLRLQPADSAGRDAEMILHAANLLLRSGVDGFRKRVEAVGAAYAEQGLSLDLSGPWPPYNFCPPLHKSQDEAPGVLRSA